MPDRSLFRNRVAGRAFAHVAALALALFAGCGRPEEGRTPQTSVTRQAVSATFVQVNSATPQSAQSAVTIPFKSAQTAGNLDVVVVGWNDTTAAVASVTDSKGNVYALAVGPTARTGLLSQSIYYAKNIAAAAAGANSVTVSFTPAAQYPDVRILEYSGIDTVSPIDVTAAASGTGTASATTAVTTTNPSDLLFAANMVTSSTNAAGSGWTSRVISYPDGDIAEDRSVTATGSYTSTAAIASGDWVMQMVAFRTAGSTPDTQPPTAPSGLTATAASASQVNLSWTAATDNVGVTAYLVESCAGSGCANFAQIASVTSTSYSNTGLTAGTSYSYRVRATDAAGNLGPYSNVASAATPAPDTQPPTAPSGLSATATTGQISLGWTASTDNVGVTSYLVERCQGTGCSGFAQVGTATATSYADTGLGASTSYSYRVRATDAAGNLSAYSNVASATTPAGAPAPPAYVQGNSATPQSAQSSVTLAYAAAQGAGDLNVVVVGWNDTAASVASVTDSKGNSYAPAVGPTTRTGLLSQSVYYAKNIAAAAAGTNSVTVSFAGAAQYPDVRILEYSGLDPVSPLDVTAAASGTGTSSSTSAVSTTAASGLLFAANMVTSRTTAAGSGWTSRMITAQDGDIAEDRVVAAAGSYTSTATIDNGDWVMQMVAFRAGSAGPDTQPPTAPSNLTATAISGSQINLAWSAATDNVGVTNYLVESCAGVGCSSFAQIAIVTGTSFSNTGLVASTSYSYRVRATDAAGNLGPYSSVATAATPTPDTQPPSAPTGLSATPSGTQINLSWTASTDDVGVTAYLVERCQGSGCSTFAQVGTSGSPSYSDTGLSAGTTYGYRVRASDAAGNLSGYSNVASATTSAAVSNPTYVQGAYGTPQTATSSVTVTYGGVQAAGDLNVVVIGWNDSTSTIASVTDTKGNSYGVAVAPKVVPGVSQAIYFATNIVAANGGENKVTVTFSGAAQYPDVRILEYQGIVATGAVDATASNSGTGTTTSSGSLSTSNPVDLLLAANMVQTLTSAAGAGFTSRMITVPDGDIAEDQIVTATGSYTATALLNQSSAWIMQLVAFKGSALPPTPDTTPPTVSITSPAGGATLSGTITMTVVASDAQTGVEGTQALVDGVVASFPDAASPYQLTVDTTKFANGTHLLGATATDGAGNTGYAAQVSVTFSNSNPGNPAVTGLFSGTNALPIVPVHVAQLPAGKILMWDGQSFGYDGRVWDTMNNSVLGASIPSNAFCTGHEQMADGRIFMAGGHAGGAHLGLTASNLFDASTMSWTVLPDMNYPRWYPTVTMLPDGRLFVMSGESSCDGCYVQVPEIYSPATNTWAHLTSAQAQFTFPYYPHMYVLPDGRLLVAGTTEAPIVSQIFDFNAQSWSAVGGPAVDGGSSAMYRPGKILKSGTSVDPDTATRTSMATAYVLDTTQSSPAWRAVAPMNFPRTYHTLTVLPDGNVLATGGGPTTAATDTANATLQAELWSPSTETWTTLGSMSAPRLYHSSALLMPDARVLILGGGRFDDTTAPTDQFSAEFYAPPYLFKGPRPAITSAPASVAIGSQFTVQTPDAARIASVVLMRFGSVTHDINMAQRYVPLTFTAGSGSLTVNAPASSNLATPGNYMLFLVDTNGVPSVSATVRL